MLELQRLDQITAALRSEPGMHRVIAEIDRRLEGERVIQLAGDYLSIPSINGSVVSGETAARRLSDTLARRRTRSHLPARKADAHV